jgi:hypothetical protein
MDARLELHREIEPQDGRYGGAGRPIHFVAAFKCQNGLPSDRPSRSRLMSGTSPVTCGSKSARTPKTTRCSPSRASSPAPPAFSGPIKDSSAECLSRLREAAGSWNEAHNGLFNQLVGKREDVDRHVEPHRHGGLGLSTRSCREGACSGRPAGVSPLRMRSM